MIDKNHEKLVKLEATLYSAGRPVSINDIKKVIGTSSNKTVHKIIDGLSQLYKKRGSAFEIKLSKNGRAFLQVKGKYNQLIKGITSRPLLTIGPLKTLSYIAFNQPVEQTQIINERGSHAYSHLYKIEKLGLIIREPGESGGYIVNTTPFFSDYFGFNHDPIKSKIQLQEIFNELKISKIENGNSSFSNKIKEFTELWERNDQMLSNYSRAED
jgi:segregation and condensation protein B